MRFLLGVVSGIVAVVALRQSAITRRQARPALRRDWRVPPTNRRNLARYYYVSLN